MKLKLNFANKALFLVCVAALICLAIAPYIIRMNNEKIGRDLVFGMYNFHPMEMIEQNERLRKILSADIADMYLLSNDSRQLNVYLRFEMKPASPVILYQNNTSVTFTIDGEAMEPNRIFQIDFKHSFGRVTFIREFELFPLPPSGIWSF